MEGGDAKTGKPLKDLCAAQTRLVISLTFPTQPFDR
jgi:hypothetical protein